MQTSEPQDNVHLNIRRSIINSAETVYADQTKLLQRLETYPSMLSGLFNEIKPKSAKQLKYTHQFGHRKILFHLENEKREYEYVLTI